LKIGGELSTGEIKLVLRQPSQILPVLERWFFNSCSVERLAAEDLNNRAAVYSQVERLSNE
jgi:hypothetical protein